MKKENNFKMVMIILLMGITLSSQAQISKEMRKEPTKAEALLWNYLIGNKIGVHFRRQHPIFGYIPDFVCLSHKLIIEIDGGYHLEGEQPEKDEEVTDPEKIIKQKWHL